MSQNEETTIAANLQETVHQLNEQLARASALGLKVDAGVTSYSNGHRVLSVRVWKEIELLREPPPKPLFGLSSDPKEWSRSSKERFLERERKI